MSEAHKRPYRHPKYKTSYHVKNWPEYEKSLRNRGNITVWLSQNAIDTWMPLKTGRLGGQQIYSDLAIETALMLRLVFHLPLRQMEGFLRSILMMGLDLPCLDHTPVSRRNRTVGILNHIDAKIGQRLRFICTASVSPSVTPSVCLSILWEILTQILTRLGRWLMMAGYKLLILMVRPARLEHAAF